MLFIISPAKSLDFNIQNLPKKTSHPIFLNKSEILIKELKKFSKKDLSKLMKISDKLADLNFGRYQNFSTPFSEKNAKPALFVFNGDVYDAIDELNYNDEELDFSQKNLRILSGLYGVLKPLDLMQPYRLEMSTSLKNPLGRNLYEFWSKEIVDYFNKALNNEEEKVIVNLASEEYSNAINQKELNGKLLNIVFKNGKNGTYKNVGLFSKRARGLMSNFIIKNKINQIADLKSFDEGGYKFKPEFSDNLNWHFYD